MKLTRRAAARIELIVATRAAEKKQERKLNWDKLMEYTIPIG